MKFAKWTYFIAGVYGLIILIPQYLLETKNGIDYPPPINHPEYYYGFVGVAISWQIVFLLIATDPTRYRIMMIASVLEKFSYGIAITLLFIQNRIASPVFATGIIDLSLGVLFIISFLKLKAQS
jgi:hypothetical protein